MLAVTTVATNALAHAPPEAIDLVWTDPPSVEMTSAGPDLIVTNRGLVFLDEKGRASLRCNEAYGISTADRPGVIPTSAGELLLGLYHGVYRTPDRACSLLPTEGLPDLSVTALVTVADALLVATRSATEPAGLLVSENDGALWTERYQTTSGSYFRKLFAAPGDPPRVYAEGFSGAEEGSSAFCGVSRDAGETWQTHPLHPTATLFAVHPTDSAGIFASIPPTMPMGAYQLLRSDDACESFKPVASVPGQPKALTEFGGALWLGVDGGGLFRSTDGGDSFTPTLEGEIVSVNCLVARGQTLYACATTSSNLRGVFHSDDDGETFAPYLLTTDVDRPVVCDDATHRAVCAEPWYDFDSENQVELTQRAHAGMDADVQSVGMQDAGVQGAGMQDAGVQRRDAERAERSFDAGGCTLGRRDPSDLATVNWPLLLAGLALCWGVRRPPWGSGTSCPDSTDVLRSTVLVRRTSCRKKLSSARGTPLAEVGAPCQTKPLF